MKRFESSRIFDNNPYIKNVYYVSDPWNDFPNSSIGFYQVEQQGIEIARKNGIPRTYFLNQPPPTHKIIKNAQLLGLKNLSSYNIDVFSSAVDMVKAQEIINEHIGYNKFGFIQTNTGAGPHKDLPSGFGEEWLRQHLGLEHFIEIGKTFKYDDYDINVQFEILRNASGVCIPDSVFYHACSGLGKNIDFVFFGRGVDVYNRVRKLNDNITEKVHYKIPMV